jgi:hypothetical protein
MYNYPTKAEMEKNKNGRYWVAPELFYVYGLANSETAIERVQRKHLYTKESEAFVYEGIGCMLGWEAGTTYLE